MSQFAVRKNEDGFPVAIEADGWTVLHLVDGFERNGMSVTWVIDLLNQAAAGTNNADLVDKILAAAGNHDLWALEIDGGDQLPATDKATAQRMVEETQGKVSFSLAVTKWNGRPEHHAAALALREALSDRKAPTPTIVRPNSHPALWSAMVEVDQFKKQEPRTATGGDNLEVVIPLCWACTVAVAEQELMKAKLGISDVITLIDGAGANRIDLVHRKRIPIATELLNAYFRDWRS
jgi:hypothetical protein